MTDLYYDPHDVAIDDDPHPVWKRMRDEAPLYYNERYDFFALSRWEDVEPALSDWDTYRSGRGTIFELIREDFEIPPGIILFEDPPIHDLHRNVLARVFTPRRMTVIEPLIRNYCAHALDKLVGADRFDVIAEFAAEVPMRTVGYLLGIPESDQESIRKQTDDTITMRDGELATFDQSVFDDLNQLVAEYVDWRYDHPSDDLMTALINAEVEDEDGTRKLTRTEVLTYTTMIVGAGNETATRLIGFAAQLLAENPDQRDALIDDPSLSGDAVEEILRFEAPSPVQCRYVEKSVEVRGTTIPEGAIMLLINGSANRDERHFPDADRFDIRRRDGAHLSFGYGLHYCLGAALARLEGRVAIEEMVRRWPAWVVDYEAAERAHTASVRGWASLPIVVG